MKEDKDRLDRQQHTVRNLVALFAATGDEDLRADIGRAHQRLGELQHANGDDVAAYDSFMAANEIWRSLGRVKADFLTSCKACLSATLADIDGASWESLLERIDETPALEVYRDFVHDFRAQSAMHHGDPEQALADLNVALEIRLAASRGQRQIDDTHARIEEAASAAALLAETD